MDLLTVSKPQLFEYLGYEPHEGQVEVHRSDAKQRVLACGARWGKSTCAAMEVVAALLEPCESSIGWVVAPTYDLCLRVFGRVEIIVRERLEHRIVEINSREKKIVLRNLGGGKSTVVGKSAEKPTGLLGEGLDWVVVDEAARLKRSVWESFLSQRLIDKDGWSLLLSTPRGCDWFYSLYRRGQRHEPGFASWRSPSWTNPLLKREVIDAERDRLPEEAFAQEYESEFTGELQEPCDICGGPDPDVIGTAVVVGEYEFSLCAECSKEIDEEGHTLWTRWPDGTPYFGIVKLVYRSPEYVSLPGDDPNDPNDPVEYEEADYEDGADEPKLFKPGEFFANSPG